MDPILAKQIALGDADPITGLPMDDINPGFVPRVLKPLPLVVNSASQSAKKKRQSTRKFTNWGYSKLLRFALLFLFSISHPPMISMLYRSKSHYTSCETKHTTRSH